MEVPQGFDRIVDDKKHVLILKRSTHGKESNYNVYNNLSTVLRARKILRWLTDSCAHASKKQRL